MVQVGKPRSRLGDRGTGQHANPQLGTLPHTCTRKSKRRLPWIFQRKYQRLGQLVILVCVLIEYAVFHSKTFSKWNQLPENHFARTIGCYFASEGHILHIQRFPTYRHDIDRTQRRNVPNGWPHAQHKLQNSKLYRRRMPDPLEDKNCQVQHHWQLQTFPSCNLLHECDLVPKGTATVAVSDANNHFVKVVAHGYWRDVWSIPDYHSQLALKTIRVEHDIDARNFDRNRRDAMASQRLTSSPYIVDIYGYCGNSGIYEYSTGGTVEELIWPDHGECTLSSLDKLKVASQIAHGIAELHNSDKNEIPSISHTDITPSQFIWINGMYKLNDFNRCRFIPWHRDKDEACFFEVGNNPGKYRSPEEYAYVPLSEKIDVFSMGTTFYSLLTEIEPYQHMGEAQAQKKFLSGNRPFIPQTILDSVDPNIVALRESISMSWTHNSSERSSAKDVANYLDFKLNYNLSLNIPTIV